MIFVIDIKIKSWKDKFGVPATDIVMGTIKLGNGSRCKSGAKTKFAISLDEGTEKLT
jgi:hypothetical protein